MNIEVHTELKYEYDAGFEYYKDAYKRLVKTGNGAELKMTNEDFYVYVLSHTAHHFSVSGTGLRSVIDHWYLRQKLLPLCDGAVLKEALKITSVENSVQGYCDEAEKALNETSAAVEEVLKTGKNVELAPQNQQIRKLQHELVEQNNLTSESIGDGDSRHVIIYSGKGDNQ